MKQASMLKICKAVVPPSLFCPSLAVKYDSGAEKSCTIRFLQFEKHVKMKLPLLFTNSTAAKPFAFVMGKYCRGRCGSSK